MAEAVLLRRVGGDAADGAAAVGADGDPSDRGRASRTAVEERPRGPAGEAVGTYCREALPDMQARGVADTRPTMGGTPGADAGGPWEPDSSTRRRAVPIARLWDLVGRGCRADGRTEAGQDEVRGGPFRAATSCAYGHRRPSMRVPSLRAPAVRVRPVALAPLDNGRRTGTASALRVRGCTPCPPPAGPLLPGVHMHPRALPCPTVAAESPRRASAGCRASAAGQPTSFLAPSTRRPAQTGGARGSRPEACRIAGARAWSSGHGGRERRCREGRTDAGDRESEDGGTEGNLTRPSASAAMHGPAAQSQVPTRGVVRRCAEDSVEEEAASRAKPATGHQASTISTWSCRWRCPIARWCSGRGALGRTGTTSGGQRRQGAVSGAAVRSPWRPAAAAGVAGDGDAAAADAGAVPAGEATSAEAAWCDSAPWLTGATKRSERVSGPARAGWSGQRAGSTACRTFGGGRQRTQGPGCGRARRRASGSRRRTMPVRCWG